MDIDKVIRKFSDFINSSWNIVTPMLMGREYTSDLDSINDWLQANWELMVERGILELNNYLEVYGDGADFNGEYGRITDIKAVPTHRVKVVVNNAIDLLNNVDITNKEYVFDKLVGFHEGFYTNTTPFNYILIHDIGGERIFSIDSIKFRLEKI